MNRPRVLHDCRDIELQRYLGHDLDLLGSRDHWIRNMEFPIGGQFELTVYLARFFEILSFKGIGVTTLTFWGYVTPSVT